VIVILGPTASGKTRHVAYVEYEFQQDFLKAYLDILNQNRICKKNLPSMK
jgi:uncharacterized protein YkwD